MPVTPVTHTTPIAHFPRSSSAPALIHVEGAWRLQQLRYGGYTHACSGDEIGACIKKWNARVDAAWKSTAHAAGERSYTELSTVGCLNSRTGRKLSILLGAADKAGVRSSRNPGTLGKTSLRARVLRINTGSYLAPEPPPALPAAEPLAGIDDELLADALHRAYPRSHYPSLLEGIPALRAAVQELTTKKP